jgi:hypothetical protein
MTEFATLPQTLFMYVIGLVTNVAVACCRFESSSKVALLTGRNSMQAD